MRSCSWLTALSVLCLICVCSCKEKTPEPHPNILLILADQWRGQATGYAGDGNVKTPNIDKLAAISADLGNAVSGLPVCTPYRASLMTGQRPLTNGVFMNDVMLDTSALTLPEVLAENGYQTGLIGKWHLDGQYRLKYTPPGPRRQGFQYWKAVNCDHQYNHSVYYFNDDTTLHYWEGYDATAQTQSAKQYLDDHKNTGKPFFLMLSWGPPHAPYHTAPEKYTEMYDSADIKLRPNVPDSMQGRARYDLAGYYAHMSALDDMVGELIEKLKEDGLFDNTIIVFTSDHGDLLGSHGHYKKQRPYDECIRVPLLIHYGGQDSIKNGLYKAMSNAEDIMPTLLGLSHVAIPGTVEGVDLSGYLRGRVADPKDTVAIITCIQPFGQWTRAEGGKEIRGIRTPNYTYVRDLNGPWLLFDDASDPYQMDNLVGNPAYSDLQQKLDQILQQKLQETHDEFKPGEYYVKKFHYPALDSTGTVPYFFNGTWHM